MPKEFLQKISIVIPVFNASQYLEETLNSVLIQTYQSWECIIVDDGSHDDSVLIIQKYQCKDSRFVFISRSDFSELKGASSCRNVGISNSSSNFIIFLDSDDLLSENCLEKRMEEVNDRFFDFFVFTTQYFFKNPGKDNLKIVNRFDKLPIINFLEGTSAWQTSSVLWSKSFLNRLNGFDPLYPRLQDHELHTRALLHPGVRYYVSNNKNSDSYYRIFRGSSGTKKNSLIVNIAYEGAKRYFFDISNILDQQELSSLKKHFLIFLIKLQRMLVESDLDEKSRNSLFEKLLDLVETLKYEKSVFIIRFYCFVSFKIRQIPFPYLINKVIQRGLNFSFKSLVKIFYM